MSFLSCVTCTSVPATSSERRVTNTKGVPETSGCRQKAFCSGRDLYLTEVVPAALIPGSTVTPQGYEARQDPGYPTTLQLRLGRCFAKQIERSHYQREPPVKPHGFISI